MTFTPSREMEDGSHPKFKGKNRDLQESLRDTEAQATVTFREACSPILLKCLENIAHVWVESVFAIPCLK